MSRLHDFIRTFVLCSMLIFHVKNSGAQVLSFDSYMSSVVREHPAAERADLLGNIASAEWLASKGAFDPTAFAEAKAKRFSGTDYYRMAEAGVSYVSPFALQLRAGQQRAEGEGSQAAGRIREHVKDLRWSAYKIASLPLRIKALPALHGGTIAANYADDAVRDIMDPPVQQKRAPGHDRHESECHLIADLRRDALGIMRERVDYCACQQLHHRDDPHHPAPDRPQACSGAERVHLPRDGSLGHAADRRIA